MASQCPKCKQAVDEDVICCAELTQTWKCKACSKLSTGFVVPYGRCFMCGGDLEIVEGYATDDPKKTQVIEEAVRYEVEMFQFYKLAGKRTKNETLKAVLEEMHEKEVDHLNELETKYHVHLDAEVKELPPEAEKNLSGWLFEGINFDDGDGHVRAVYDKAIEMEKRTRDHFIKRSQELPEGPERAIYKELAAEEEEHVVILETEREQLG